MYINILVAFLKKKWHTSWDGKAFFVWARTSRKDLFVFISRASFSCIYLCGDCNTLPTLIKKNRNYHKEYILHVNVYVK